MSQHLNQVKEFHRKVGDEPITFLDIERTTPQREFENTSNGLRTVGLALQLRAEQFKASTFSISQDPRRFRAYWMMSELGETLEAMADLDEVETLDGLIDLAYVLLGTAIKFDMPFDPGFQEVHESNMSKGKDAGKLDGDRGKDANYIAPNIVKVLKEYRDGL